MICHADWCLLICLLKPFQFINARLGPEEAESNMWGSREQKGGSPNPTIPELHLHVTMSVLTPILTPLKVKEFLTKGERFIKWDDVSSTTAFVSSVSAVNLETTTASLGFEGARKGGLWTIAFTSCLLLDPKYVYEKHICFESNISMFVWCERKQ